MKIYYVYEHWRTDLDVCFYVGKGKKGRAYSRHNRGNKWRNIVNKLETNGFSYEVRIVIDGITEQDSFDIEKSRISFWRSINVQLANITDGGEGFSGVFHSDETKKLISLKKKGVSISGEKRKGKPAHNKGKKGLSGPDHPMFNKKHSEETKKLISEKGKGRSPPNKGKESPLKGKPGTKRSEESKLKQSETRKSRNIVAWNKGLPGLSGENHPMFGRNHTEQTKEKIRLAKRAKKEPENV